MEVNNALGSVDTPAGQHCRHWLCRWAPATLPTPFAASPTWPQEQERFHMIRSATR